MLRLEVVFLKGNDSDVVICQERQLLQILRIMTVVKSCKDSLKREVLSFLLSFEWRYENDR